MPERSRAPGPQLVEIPPTDDFAAPQEEPQPPRSPRRGLSLPVALRHRDYRLFWGGQFVSMAGSQMQVVATAWLLYELTGSELALGLVGLFRAVPLISFALFGGVIADNFDRRRLLLITQTCLLAISLTLALTTTADLIQPWLVYLLIALAATANAFDNPARSALIPNLVPREHLANALSLGIINGQVASVVGPSIAGLIIGATGGAAAVYWLDAASFLGVIAALLLMRTRLPRVETRQVNFSSAVEGLRFVFSSPIMLSTMALDFFATLFGVSILLLPAFADKVLHVEAAGLGLLYSAQAAGAVVASVIMSLIGEVRYQGRVVLVSVAAYGICGFIFGASHLYWLSVLALAGTGAADTVSMVMRQTIRQLITPNELRGRMTSVNMIFFMGGPQLGNLQSGTLAQLLGPSQATMLTNLGVLAITGLTAYLVPKLRNYRADG